jgi:hypothetical protein
MRCAGYAYTTLLVGLQRVGITGSRKAFEEADRSGLNDREAKIDLMIEILARENYLPGEDMEEAYRRALWREYLRQRGEDFREYYSEVDVVIHGEAGEERDQFVELLHSIFGTFELKPIITYAPGRKDGANPQLVIDGHTIVQGLLNRKNFKKAVQKSFTDW